MCSTSNYLFQAVVSAFFCSDRSTYRLLSAAKIPWKTFHEIEICLYIRSDVCACVGMFIDTAHIYSLSDS